MFCDLVGSTDLLNRIGAEALRDITHRFQRRVADVSQDYQGFIARYMGDGVLVYFGYPNADEASTENAIRTSLLLAGEPSDQAGPLPYCVRIGVATGLVIVGDLTGSGPAREHAAFGETVNLAARLQMYAEPNGILICNRTREMAGDLFMILPHAALPLKGFPAAVTTWRVSGTITATSRFQALRARKGLTPFAGRQRELSKLAQLLCSRPTHVRAIEIVGEAGIGKSRLLHELRRKLDGENRIVLQAGCSPDGLRSTYLPFKRIFKQLLGFEFAAFEGENAGQRFAASLEPLGLATALNIAILCNFLGLAFESEVLRGLDPVLLGLRTSNFLIEILRRHSWDSEIVLFLEDLHWVDRASASLIQHLIETEAELRMTILYTRRPQSQPSWVGCENVTSIPLLPLAFMEAKHIIQSRLGFARLPEPLTRLIVEKADGNPLFIEEIITFLLERDIVCQLPSGLTFDAAAAANALPINLDSLLISRVSELSRDDRLLLDMAAVIGRRFDIALIDALADIGPLSRQRLLKLEAADLIRPTAQAGIYSFKHALLRDALYGSLLADARATLHLMAAEKIEQRCAGRLVEVAEELARHYSFTRRTEKAVEFLYLAGHKSFRVFSLEAAEAFFQQALLLREQDPDAVPDQLAGALFAEYLSLLGLQAKFPRATSFFERHQALFARFEDQRPYVRALNFACFAYFMQTRFADASNLARLAVTLAKTINDDLSRVYAASALIYSETAGYSLSSDNVKALAEEMLQTAEIVDDGFILVRLLFDIAFYSVIRGDFLEGRRFSRRLQDVGLERGDPRAICFAEWTHGLVYVAEGNADSALVCGEAALASSTTPWDRVGSLWVKTAALVALRRAEEAKSTLSELKYLCFVSNDQLSSLSAELFEGALLILSGRLLRGLRRIERCIHEWDKRGWANYADWVRVNLAEIYLEMLSPAEKLKRTFLLRNLPILLRLRLVAPRRAGSLIERALASTKIGRQGYMHARMRFDAGMIEIARRNYALARSHLEVSRALATKLDETTLQSRIDVLILKLGGHHATAEHTDPAPCTAVTGKPLFQTDHERDCPIHETLP